MGNKIIISLLVLIIGFLGFITVQHYKLEKKVDALLSRQGEDVNITPAGPDNSSIANPAGASPFDKPNVDPLGDQFPPNSATPPPLTEVKFEKTEHNFGKLKEGNKVSTTFHFTNTGKNPLIISKAVGSCGCTVPRWPKSPVAPGKSGEIEVEFDSADKSGEQMKTVSVSTNTSTPFTELVIRATIIPKTD